MKSYLMVLVCVLAASFSVAAQKKDNRLAEPTSQNNIVHVAVQLNSTGSPYAGQFDTLIAAVLAADPIVLDTLTKKGQLTVFAPTDSAFEALGLNPQNIGTVDRNLLTQILLYHVTTGRRTSADVLGSTRIRSLQGTFFFPATNATITDATGRVANIIATDVPALNGVIHAIDQVILPFQL